MGNRCQLSQPVTITDGISEQLQIRFQNGKIVYNSQLEPAYRVLASKEPLDLDLSYGTQQRYRATNAADPVGDFDLVNKRTHDAQIQQLQAQITDLSSQLADLTAKFNTLCLVAQQ